MCCKLDSKIGRIQVVLGIEKVVATDTQEGSLVLLFESFGVTAEDSLGRS